MFAFGFGRLVTHNRELSRLLYEAEDHGSREKDNPLSSFNFGIFVQNGIQQRPVDFDMAIVVDEAQLPEFVHEEAHAGPGRSDHIRKRFLTDFRYDGLWLSFLAKIRQEQKQTGEALFARVEELIDKVRFYTNIAAEKVRGEQLRKLTFVVNHAKYKRLGYAGGDATCHRDNRGHAQCLSAQASLAKKIAGSKERYHGLFPLLGKDGYFDFSALEVEDRIGVVSLRKDDLALTVLTRVLTSARFCEKQFRI